MAITGKIGFKKLILSTFIVLILINASMVFSQKTIRNPIIPGYNPDPTICRVGNDFYIVTSSNEYFPGLPVYHSRDLANWKMIGHVLNRPSQLNLDSVNCSGGIYAPTLRYHNGTFYLMCTLAALPKGRPRGNFIATATNPAGPWSEPVWLPDAPGIDPSLFFDDDGKVYYQGNMTPEKPVWDKHRDIWIQEIDLKNMKLTGQRKIILDGSEYYKNGTLGGGYETGVNNYESPHIYKKNGWYYLLIAHGGTFQTHAVSIWRSKNVFGPYEINPANPILTHRDLCSTFEITSTGHADFVEVPDKSWWMVFHARRPYGGEYHILGREVFITPVDWKGDWPIVNPQCKPGRAGISVNGFKTVKPKVDMFYDDFKSEKLNPAWTFLRTPNTNWWSLDKSKGLLQINLRPETISDISNPSFIGIRLEQPDFIIVTKMDFVPGNENEEAGLVLLRDRESWFRFVVRKVSGKICLSLLKPGDERVKGKEINISSIFLRISAKGVSLSFSYSDDGKKWESLSENVDGRILGAQGLGRFTGTFAGIYASGNGKQSKNMATFDWFEYKNQ